MKTSDFNFELPEHLIAQHPSEQRGMSRLMTLDRAAGKCSHGAISQLPKILCEEKFLSCAGKKPLLVFNDTKVRKARLIGKNEQSGAVVEFLLIEVQANIWKTLAKHAKRRKAGQRFVFFDTEGKKTACAQIVREENEFRFLEFDRPIDDEWLDLHGHIPLPPYIKRSDNPADALRYQTIYANKSGSAAAPTAGLHFTKEILDAFLKNGIETAFITLHVGLGTFLPVRSENIKDHAMHEEQFIITEKTARQIESAKNEGQKITAVGTTSLRALESAFFDGKIKQGQGSTSIFIYPGFKFNVVDALFTNFHTPQSTLLMLVSAFAGRELILESYAEAVREEYRFFSYGDAMLIY
jgi:S-adenosylmethionine:tRNA ribosyltransferase-isomerase